MKLVLELWVGRGRRKEKGREGSISNLESKDRTRHTSIYKAMATSIRTSSIMHSGSNVKALPRNSIKSWNRPSSFACVLPPRAKRYMAHVWHQGAGTVISVLHPITITSTLNCHRYVCPYAMEKKALTDTGVDDKHSVCLIHHLPLIHALHVLAPWEDGA